MGTRTEPRHVPLLLWPFWAIWRLLLFILNMTGRLIGAILGLVLMIVGVVLSVTVIGAVIGLPIAVFGLLLVIASLF